MNQIHTEHHCDPASLQEHRWTKPSPCVYGKVQSQVGGSKSTDDHLTVIPLLTDGMKRLGSQERWSPGQDGAWTFPPDFHWLVLSGE